MRLYEAGYSIRKISRTLKYSRNTISKYLNGDMESVCTPELTSGVDRYRDYIIKALSKGICRSNLYRDLEKQGLRCGKTAAYDYMNRLAEIHGIDISLMKDATPEQKEKQKQIRKYDYLSRKSVFRYLWMELEAVENAVSSPLSNGFVEGTNSKLKMVKRTMYGRCSRQLLAAKLMLVVL